MAEEPIHFADGRLRRLFMNNPSLRGSAWSSTDQCPRHLFLVSDAIYLLSAFLPHHQPLAGFKELGARTCHPAPCLPRPFRHAHLKVDARYGLGVERIHPRWSPDHALARPESRILNTMQRVPTFELPATARLPPVHEEFRCIWTSTLAAHTFWVALFTPYLQGRLENDPMH